MQQAEQEKAAQEERARKAGYEEEERKRKAVKQQVTSLFSVLRPDNAPSSPIQGDTALGPELTRWLAHVCDVWYLLLNWNGCTMGV